MRLTTALVVALTLATSTSVAQPVTLSGSGTFAVAPGVGGLGAGAFTFSVELPRSPVPTVSVPDETFVLADIAWTFRQGALSTLVTGDAFFFTATLGGLFDFDIGAASLLAPFDGPQLFTGPTETPTFVLGTWTPADPDGFGLGSVTQLSVTSSPATIVPEPATMVLVSAGLVLVGGVAGLRRRTHASTGHR